MFEMGFVVALGLVVTMFKSPWSVRLWMTSHPLLMDLVVFVFLTLIHWGTFSGVMVASIGALFCSLTLSACKKLFGHIAVIDGQRTYYRGMFDVASKL